MEIKIALILKKHFADYCRGYVKESWNGCRVDYYEYDTLEQMKKIYDEICTQYNGIVTSGILPMRVLRERVKGNENVIEYFGGYLENTYRLLLVHLLKKKEVNPDKIGIDYLKDGMVLEDILERDQLSYLVEEFSDRITKMSVQDLEQEEKELVDDYLKRCRAGKLDFVITSFYSVVEALQKENVECYYSYPGRHSLLQTLDMCLKNIKIAKEREKIAAVIRIDGNDKAERKSEVEKEYEILEWKKSMLNYFREKGIEPVFKSSTGKLEIYLNMEHIKRITDRLESSDLPEHLKKTAGFSGIVSIGLGNDLQKARINAEEAEEYGKHMDKERIFLIDETGAIHSMKIRGRQENYTCRADMAKIERIAGQVHLSPESILRVLAVLQTEDTRDVTAADLVRLQNFSLRVATRVLTALQKGGYAKLIGRKNTGSKGRPQNLYRIEIE